VALSVTEVPEGKLAVQVVGQLIPAGLQVTVPVPVIATVKLEGGLLALDVPPHPTRLKAEARETARTATRKLKTTPTPTGGI
jgi:hypothetical protein